MLLCSACSWLDGLVAEQQRCRVRHEAAEALGAINTAECLDSLARHQQDSCLEVR